MHLALIEAMYQMKMIGGFQDDNKDSNVGNNIDQERRYFVVGVEKDEWDVKGRKIIMFPLRCSELNKQLLYLSRLNSVIEF